jgi:hypothetical protein
MPPLSEKPVGFSGPSSNVWTTPYPHALGDRAHDKNGNEYIFVQCVTAIAGEGILVSIDPLFQAAPLLHTSLLNARVGIAQHQLAVGEAGWAQIYGIAFVQGNNMAANAIGVGSSTDATSIGVLTSTSEQDALGLTPIPQLVVTSPTGTLNFAGTYIAAAEDQSSLVSASSNTQLGAVNYIQGMALLTAAQVSALPDAFIAARYPTVTSPVSAVSNTTGPVTLTTYVSGTTGGHIGGEWVVFLNYPMLSGNKTS